MLTPLFRCLMPFVIFMQMAFQQVVRMTRCDNMLGYPAMLREMLSYLGYVWYPEY